MDFDNLFKKAIRLLGVKKKFANIVQVEKEGQAVENLIEKCNYKTRISSVLNCFIIPPSVPTYQPLNFPATFSVQTSGADYQPVDKKIDYLTKMMKGLALLVQTLQNNTDLLTIENTRPQLPSTFLTNILQPNNPAFYSQLDWPEGVTKYLYCWAKDHYLKRYYQVFQDDFNLNQIYMGNN